MKKFNFLLLLMTFFAVTFYSCSDNESVKNQAVTTESSAFRLMLNDFKQDENISGKLAKTNGASAFEFVFPITLSYNNGTVITVSSLDGLLSILSNENSEIYISGIAFPFDVIMTETGTTVAINNEQELWDNLSNMDVTTYDDYVFNSVCYDFVYPISFITNNEQVVTVASKEALYDLFTDPNQVNLIYGISYPFSVNSNGQTVVVNNEYEYAQINTDCNPTEGCICPTVYDPVCVQTATGAIQLYPNACTAECEGYTAADFVDCGGGNFILDKLGICFNMVYPVQLYVDNNVVTVNNDSELLNYLNPNTTNSTLIFPLDINTVQTNSTYTMFDGPTMKSIINGLCY